MKQVAQILSLTSTPPRKQRRRKVDGILPVVTRFIARAAAWLRKGRLSGLKRGLRLVESVPLGEKRFVAVVEYQSQRFLIGGGAQTIQLLTKLRGSNFSKTLASKQALVSEEQ